MDQSSPPDPFCIAPSKIVHEPPREQPAVALPKHAILLDTLRAVERRLQDRGLLQLSAQQQPLWFLAEQERNEYLWRQGHSLANSEQFDFWVDLPKLIRRRMAHLQVTEPGGLTGTLSEHETRYLDALMQAIGTVEKHLSALSRAVSIFRLEIEAPREIVVLPQP